MRAVKTSRWGIWETTFENRVDQRPLRVGRLTREWISYFEQKEKTWCIRLVYF